MQAIQTIYKGYKFRSRLEARWAVFFDAMRIEWEYEKEGFVLDKMAEKDDRAGIVYDSSLFYLPDFYLPEEQLYVEVKPYGFTKPEFEKAWRFARHFPIVGAKGIPDILSYPLLEWLDAESDISKTLIQRGTLQYKLDRSGANMDDLPCVVSYNYTFGEQRARKYLDNVFKRAQSTSENDAVDPERFMRQGEPGRYKWKQALERACNIARQARFEYGESG